MIAKLKIGTICALASIAMYLMPIPGSSQARSTHSSGTVSPTCLAQSTWITAPSPPAEIPATPDGFCGFYQFSWQWFLQLVSPSATAGLRNFEVQANFPLVQSIQNQTCAKTGAAIKHRLFLRNTKPQKSLIGSTSPIPESINQAKDGATIYDKYGNVVFYEMRVSQSECNTPFATPQASFPANTTEIKLAWRQLNSLEILGGQYYMTTTSIENVNNGMPITLGLVGFHLAISTPNHPEFIWITFEHESNSPNCNNAQSAPNILTGWSFLNSGCASCLTNNSGNLSACSACNFNQAASQTGLVGQSTSICKIPLNGDPNAPSPNSTDIDSLNQQLTGPTGLLASTTAPGMKVWSHYRNIGALWLINPANASSDSTNQAGSTQLANSVMETTFQAPFPGAPNNSTNCFGCHKYSGTGSANTVISHVYPGILSQSTVGKTLSAPQKK